MLFAVALGALHSTYLGSALDQGHDLGFVFGTAYQVVHQRAFGSQQEEAAAEQGVGARGEYCDGLAVVLAFGRNQLEINFGTFGATDPVCLHLLNRFRPAFQLVKIVQQLLGIIGDFVVPLGKIALFNGTMAAPAFAFGYLLVCQNRFAVGAPVDRAIAALYQTALVHLQEDPLTPAIVLRVAGNNGAIPVIGKAHALETGLLRFDVGIRPLSRMGIVLDGCVFCRQTKRIPAHWMQHVVTTHSVIASCYVADGVIANMAHVNVARRVREHLEHIALRLAGILRCLMCACFGPHLLPTRLNLVRIVFFHEA